MLVQPQDTTFAKGFELLQNIPFSNGKSCEVTLWRNNKNITAKHPFGQAAQKVATLEDESGIQKLSNLPQSHNWTLRLKVPKTDFMQPFPVHMLQDPLGNQTYMEFYPRDSFAYHLYDFTIVLNRKGMTESRQNQLYMVLQSKSGRFKLIRICLNFQNKGQASLTTQFLFESQLEAITTGELYITKVDGVVVTQKAEDDMIVCSDRRFADYHGLLEVFQEKFAGRRIPPRKYLVEKPEDLLETSMLTDEEALELFTLQELHEEPMTVQFFDPSTNTGWGVVEFEDEDTGADILVPVKFIFTTIPKIDGRAIEFLEPGEVVYPNYGIHQHKDGPFRGKDHFHVTAIYLSEDERMQYTEENTLPKPVTVEDVLPLIPINADPTLLP